MRNWLDKGHVHGHSSWSVASMPVTTSERASKQANHNSIYEYIFVMKNIREMLSQEDVVTASTLLVASGRLISMRVS